MLEKKKKINPFTFKYGGTFGGEEQEGYNLP